MIKAQTLARKKVVPRSAFTAGEHGVGAKHRFKPGHKPNTPGRGKNPTRLISRALKVQLQNRAPSDVARAAGLPINASNAQVIAANLISIASRDKDAIGVGAARVIFEMVEPKKALYLDDDDGEPLEASTEQLVHIAAAVRRLIRLRPTRGFKPAGRRELPTLRRAFQCLERRPNYISLRSSEAVISKLAATVSSTRSPASRLPFSSSET